MVRYGELKPNSITLAGSELVRSWFEGFEPDSVMESGRGPASSCWFAASKIDDRPNFSSLQVCDQLRTSFEPAGVMEFGFKYTHIQEMHTHNFRTFCLYD